MRPVAIVMAKVPGAIPVKSRLHGALAPDDATALYLCFLQDRVTALRSCVEVETVVAYTPAAAASAMARIVPNTVLVPQPDADLGVRLTTLFRQYLDVGWPAAIALDSDSPTLPIERVAEAARALTSADVVLGPCEDGGYYLIGMRAPHPELFDGIPWSTDGVLATTLSNAHASGLRVHLLAPWFDVDTPDDLARLIRDPHLATRAPRTAAFLRSASGKDAVVPRGLGLT